MDVSIIGHLEQDQSPEQVKLPDPVMLLASPDLDSGGSDAEGEDMALPSMQLDSSSATVDMKKKRWPTPKKPPPCECKKNPKFYNDDFCTFVAEVLRVVNISDSACMPASYNEAVVLLEATEWIKAMCAEYGALDWNGTFELALLPVAEGNWFQVAVQD